MYKDNRIDPEVAPSNNHKNLSPEKFQTSLQSRKRNIRI